MPHSGSFVVLLATRAMCFAILAMSVDLLLGFTGLSSMGQAAYFGVGAYLTAVLRDANSISASAGISGSWSCSAC